MAPSIRPFIVVLLLGQGALLWWMSGHYGPTGGSASETKSPPTSVVVWDAEMETGLFWGNESGKVLIRDGAGVSGQGKALTIQFDRNRRDGCGLNWKGWFPSDACDDASRFKTLTFYIRQVTNVPDADLTVYLMDNVKRPSKGPVSNGLSVLGDGRVSRIDGDWRRVLLPLDRFSHNLEVDLKRLWGIDFSDNSGRTIVFQIDRIGFCNDTAPPPKFTATSSFSESATIHIDRPGYAIRDEIYGVCELPREHIAAYGLPITRWGGNRTSRFNWKINADAAGKDWYFKNGGRKIKNPSENGWIQFLLMNQEVGATGYVTVPMLGFVAKDHDSHSYSVKKHGPQQSTESGHADVGNGISPSGAPIRNNDWRDTSVAAGPEFIAEGVMVAVRHAGSSSKRYWVLDNEPMLWHETHRDVRPKPLGRDELWQRTRNYTEAIKKVDPTAKVAGFCSWGWKDLYFSAGEDAYGPMDSLGELGLAEWFIKKCGDYKREHGRSLVDVFDFHWYPEAEMGGRRPYLGTGLDVKFNQLRLRTTRDLWDPNYTPESWIRDVNGGQATMSIRRIREWIEKHNPGMEICLGEYNFGGADNITGALAQADVFGILARERVDLAFIWTTPEGTQELAWKLFRNYDNAGGRFGDRYLPAECKNNDLSVYAAKRSRDGATTIAVVNKNLGGQCTLTLDVPGLKGPMRVWRFDQETGKEVVEMVRSAGEVDGRITLAIPAASGTMIVVK